MAKKLTKLIKSQVGKGGKKYCKYMGWNYIDDWCGAFVWWCLKHCKEDFVYDPAEPGYVPGIESWAKKHKRTIKKKHAKRGDIVTFDWDGNGRGNHVGFFWSGNPEGTFKTIEGNTGSDNPRYSEVLMRTRYASQINYVIRPKKTAETAKKTESTKDTTSTKKPVKTDDTVHSTAISATYKVLPDMGMNVRKKPQVNSTRVNGIPKGTKFHATRKHDNWVYADDYKGWVCVKMGDENYLKKVK